MKLSAKTYALFKAFAQKGGSLKNAAAILGDSDPTILKGYLSHLKKDAPDLHKRWASTSVGATPAAPAPSPAVPPPAAPATPAAPAAPPAARKAPGKVTAAPPAPKEATAGLEGLFSEEPVRAGVQIDGTDYPARFRLRNEDGTVSDLELFSKNPRHGLLFEILQPD